VTRISRASYSQQAMWHDYQLSESSAVHHIMLAATVTGEIDVDALRDSLQDIADRHSALRTCLTANDGRIEQVVHEHLPVDFDVVSLDAQAAANISEVMEAEAARPFDLAADSPLRVRLFSGLPRLRILFVVHHIAADFESVLIALDELGERYRSRMAGTAARAGTDAAVGYDQFADWESEHVEGARGRRALDYWTRRLPGLPQAADWVKDRPRGASRTHAGAEIEVELPAGTVANVAEISQRYGVTRNTILLTAAHALIGRISASRHAIVGLTGSQRIAPVFRGSVGNFTNALVTITDSGAAATFADLMRQVGREVMQSVPHSGFPFPLLVEELNPVHDPSRTPFFDVLYTYNRSRHRDQDGLSDFIGGRGELDLGGPVLRQVPLRRPGALYDLSVIGIDSTSEILMVWQYNTDLLDEETVRCLAGCFTAILQAGLAEPEAPLDRVAASLPAEELRALLSFAGGGERDWEGPATVAGALEAQAARTPELVAVAAPDGTSLTYAQLHHQADRLAGRLAAAGIRPEDRVGVLVPRSSLAVIALLGIVKAGAAYVPLDAAWPAARMREVLARGGTRIVVTTRNEPAADGCPGRLDLDAVLDLDAGLEAGLDAARTGEDGSAVVRARPEPHRQAALSLICQDGEPDVVRTDGSLLNGLRSLQDRHHLGAGDIIVGQAPSGQDAAAWEVFWPLLAGARILLAPAGCTVDHEFVRQHGVTVAHFEPARLREFAAALPRAALPRAALPSAAGSGLRLVLCSGAGMTAEQLDDARSRLGCAVESVRGGPGVTGSATWQPAGRVPGGAACLGKPMPNVRCYVLDARLRPVPRGVAGELHVAGIALARGYVGRPDLTAERFRPDPFVPGQRIYRTGERARWTSAGAIEYLGPAGDQVTVNGYQVSLDDVRRAVEADAEVLSAIVVASEDDGQRRVLGYVLPGDRDAFDARKLGERLRARHPGYIVPAGIVTLDAWPAGESLPPPPADAWLDWAEDYVEPRTPLEREIAGLWADVLGVERVGAYDDFFDRGGHSVMAIRLIVRIKKRFGVSLSVRDLFEAPTLAMFVDLLLDRAQEPSEPAEQMNEARI
jgi:non-ribosomal peptide synthetase component F/aryl carrier-like protein